MHRLRTGINFERNHTCGTLHMRTSGLSEFNLMHNASQQRRALRIQGFPGLEGDCSGTPSKSSPETLHLSNISNAEVQLLRRDLGNASAALRATGIPDCALRVQGWVIGFRDVYVEPIGMQCDTSRHNHRCSCRAHLAEHSGGIRRSRVHKSIRLK